MGDKHAWDLLVERYARLVRSVPARHNLAYQDVEDVTQDVFLALARYLDQINDAEAIGKWLLITARHRSLRVAYKRSRENTAVNADLSEDLPHAAVVTTLPSLPSLAELTELWSQRELLSYGLAQLHERCRALLYRLFLDPEQPSYEQICQQLEIPKGSIGPTRKRCLAQLRLALEAHDPDVRSYQEQR
jgi:RNA polymerase sigma factor (sigma-70 family)